MIVQWCEINIINSRFYCFFPDAVPIRVEQTYHLQEEVERFKVENERLRERCDQLEIQLERFLEGQDKVQGRVYHLEKNPLSEHLEERMQKTEKLQEEVLFLIIIMSAVVNFCMLN